MARRLLVRLGSLGDVVLATAAAQAGRDLWGDRCFDVLVKEEWAAVWDGHPAVDRVWSLGPADRGVGAVVSWGARLRRERYELVVDLQNSPRTRWLGFLGRFPETRRPGRQAWRRRCLVVVKRGGPPSDYRVAQSFVDAVAPGASALPRVEPGRPAQERAQACVPDAARVGLVPGARHATKRWPLDRFLEVGRRLAARGMGPVAVFFGPEERVLRERWSALWPQEGWVPVQEDLATTAACLARLDAVVVNDTGLMHVAGAVGTPVVALFGPTVRSFGFTPVGPGHRVLEVDGLSCRPCSVHGGPRCPKGHFRCMGDLPVAEVEAAVLDLVSRVPVGDDRVAAP